MRQSLPRPVRVLATALLAGSVLLAGVLPQPSAFAHDAPTSAAPTKAPPRSGTDGALEGTLEVRYEHLQDGSGAYRHLLHLHDGTTVALEGVPAGDLLTGDHVRTADRPATQGLLQPQAPAAAGLQVLQYAPLDGTFGVQKVALLLVNFVNDPRQPYTVAEARTAFAEADAFYRETSYGQTSLEVGIFGWYTLPISNTTCDGTQIRAAAQQVALAQGIDLSQYRRHMYAFPYNPRCTFSGVGTIGGNPSTIWVNNDILRPHTIAHELGHSLGLHHSNALACHPKVVDGVCTVKSYGDITDMMGGTGHFNAFQKQRLGWLGFSDSPPMTLVETSGTYTIDSYEFPSTGPKALKIPRGTTGQFFFLELRRNQGFDIDLYRSGVFVHLGSDYDPASSLLLDMVPSTLTIAGDALLEVGKSFTDPLTGLTITTVSVSATEARILVSTTPTGPSCIRSAPHVTATPAQSAPVPAGTAVAYALSVTNTDSAACPAASLTLQATRAGWPTGFNVASLSLTPNTTGTATLTVTSPDVAPGAYTIVVTAATAAAPVLAGSTSVMYHVTAIDIPIPDPNPFADKFDRSDASALGNGWSVVTGSLAIQSGEARNAAAAPLNLAVRLGRKGAAQTVAASFASTNSNSTPRFAVVLRYQDAQNYYACYRQLGGSSVARIARVVNGVETVLKSVGVPNPAVNASSTLSCQASGSSLTLRIDGAAKVLATDTSFVTGYAGFAVSAPKVASHRVDNFSSVIQ